jgi:DNA-directed RNA polymerase specialized sigma24 family protein
MQREVFGKLIQLLGPDEDAAAAEYRRLHERLRRFFEWNSVRDPGLLADEAIDRLGKRVTEAQDAREPVRNPQAFALGVARLLLQEEKRRQVREDEAVRSWEMGRAGSPSEAEARERALEHCLDKLPPERRILIEKYYATGASKRARLREKLADELGLQMNALRNRALRARHQLEACMRNILEQ